MVRLAHRLGVQARQNDRAANSRCGAGNLFDFTPDTPANADHCFDPWNQFTRIGAILTAGNTQNEGVATLTRVLWAHCPHPERPGGLHVRANGTP